MTLSPVSMSTNPAVETDARVSGVRGSSRTLGALENGYAALDTAFRRSIRGTRA